MRCNLHLCWYFYEQNICGTPHQIHYSGFFSFPQFQKVCKSFTFFHFHIFFSVSPLREYFPPVSSAISICSALRRSSKILTQTTPLCSFQICQTFHYQHLQYFNNQIRNWLYHLLNTYSLWIWEVGQVPQCKAEKGGIL